MVTTRRANGISRPCARFSPPPVRRKKTGSKSKSRRKATSHESGVHTTEELDEAITPVTEELDHGPDSKAKPSRSTRHTLRAVNRGSKVRKSTALSQRPSFAANKAVIDALSSSKRIANPRSDKHKEAEVIEGDTNEQQHKGQKAPAKGVKSNRGVLGDPTLAELAPQVYSSRVRGNVPHKGPVTSPSKRKRRQFQIQDQAFRPELDLETAEEDSTDDREAVPISKRKRKPKDSSYKPKTLNGIWRDVSPTSEKQSAVHPVRNTRSLAQARRRTEALGGAPPLYTNKLEPPSERGLAQDPVMFTKFATDKDPKGNWHFKHRRSAPSVHRTSQENKIIEQKGLQGEEGTAWNSHYSDKDRPNVKVSESRETELQCKLNHVESGANYEKRQFRREQRDRKAVATGGRKITSVSFNLTAEQAEAERQKSKRTRSRRRSSTTYPALERPTPLVQARKSSSSSSSASTDASGSSKWERERLSGEGWADKLKYRQTPPSKARESQSPQSPSTGLLQHYASFMTGALKRHALTQSNSHATKEEMSRKGRSNATEDSRTHTTNEGHASTCEKHKSPLLASKRDQSFEEPGSSTPEKACNPSQHGPISGALERPGTESLDEQFDLSDNNIQEKSSIRGPTGSCPTIHENEVRYSTNNGQNDDEHNLENEIHQQLLGELHAEAEKVHPVVAAECRNE